jgi:hypothetical protein
MELKELANISSFQTLSAEKNGKAIKRVIGHGILAGKYLAEYRDSLK